MNYFLLATFYLIHFYYEAYVNRRFKRSPYATFYLIHFYYDAYVNRSIQKVTRMQHFATSFFFIFHQHVHICMSLTFQASTASEKMLACKMCFEIPPYQNSKSMFGLNCVLRYILATAAERLLYCGCTSVVIA